MSLIIDQSQNGRTSLGGIRVNNFYKRSNSCDSYVYFQSTNVDHKKKKNNDEKENNVPTETFKVSKHWSTSCELDKVMNNISEDLIKDVQVQEEEEEEDMEIELKLESDPEEENNESPGKSQPFDVNSSKKVMLDRVYEVRLENMFTDLELSDEKKDSFVKTRRPIDKSSNLPPRQQVLTRSKCKNKLTKQKSSNVSRVNRDGEKQKTGLLINDQKRFDDLQYGCYVPLVPVKFP